MDIEKLLKEYNFKHSEYTLQGVFEWAAQKGHLVICKAVHETSPMDYDTIWSTISNTCHSKNKPVLEWLLGICDSEKQPVTNGIRQGFQKAAKDGQLDELKSLYSKYNLTVDDVRSRDNCTLRWAAEGGHLDVLKWLMEKFNLNVEDVRSWNNDALRYAASNGHLDVVKWLVSTFNLNAEDVRSVDNYALLCAARNGHLDVVRYLCSIIGDPVSKWIPEAKQPVVDGIREEFQKAAKDGQLDELKSLYSKYNLTVDDVRSDDNHVLRVAASKNHLDVVEYLVKILRNRLRDLE